MNFSEALELLKKGNKLTRSGFYQTFDLYCASDSECVFIYLVKGSEFQVNRAPLNAMFEMGKLINYRPHIDIKLMDGSFGVWSPSNDDLLAEDWEVFEYINVEG